MPVPFSHTSDDRHSRWAASLLHHASRLRQPRRYLLGIAGVPGAGKSTLAESLVRRINQQQPAAAAVLPMDGFHYPNAELDRLNRRHRKGAPQTFDVHGYLNLLVRARQGDLLIFPIYDRAQHEPVLMDRPQQRVTAATRVIVTEGNYLLLDIEPWRRLANVLDACAWLEVDPDVAAQRLIARHIRGGRSPDDAQAHYQRSDALNVRQIIQHRREPDLVLRPWT
jgi:pantothenate kinase